MFTRPAPGFRDSGWRGYGGGALWYVGGNGFSWASSITTGIHAYSLYFGYGEINPNGSYSCALGFPLRCLQE